MVGLMDKPNAFILYKAGLAVEKKAVYVLLSFIGYFIFLINIMSYFHEIWQRGALASILLILLVYGIYLTSLGNSMQYKAKYHFGSNEEEYY